MLVAEEAGSPLVLHTIAEMRQWMKDARARGETIGLVPTMGALHEGHLSLARASCLRCDRTVVTVFVNPTQFAPHEDFDKYPRTLKTDVAALAQCSADVVFAPSPDEVYPEGFSTYVLPPSAASPLEGVCRPDHFRGVTTVVLKLFQMIPADIAFFGQKDYQQALVIRQMVKDLNVPLEIVVCPIVREADGLAMSSRNRYLDAEQRQRSLALWRSLQKATELVELGEKSADNILEKMRDVLEQAGVTSIDYVALADPETLLPVERVERPTMALIAAHVGATRLIDNCLLTTSAS